MRFPYTNIKCKHAAKGTVKNGNDDDVWLETDSYIITRKGDWAIITHFICVNEGSYAYIYIRKSPFTSTVITLVYCNVIRDPRFIHLAGVRMCTIDYIHYMTVLRTIIYRHIILHAMIFYITLNNNIVIHIYAPKPYWHIKLFFKSI